MFAASQALIDYLKFAKFSCKPSLQCYNPLKVFLSNSVEFCYAGLKNNSFSVKRLFQGNRTHIFDHRIRYNI